jgi:tRNA(fMet)-specific endonuclease VapC
MRHIAIDTNVYSASKKGNTEVIEIIQNVDTISIDITVIAELLAGFKNGTQENRNRQDLLHFLNNNRVELMAHDTDTAEFYAHIYSVLRKKGTPIPTNDIWIAASAM